MQTGSQQEPWGPLGGWGLADSAHVLQGLLCPSRLLATACSPWPSPRSRLREREGVGVESLECAGFTPLPVLTARRGMRTPPC